MDADIRANLHDTNFCACDKLAPREKKNGFHLLSLSVVGLRDRPKIPPPPHGGVKMAFWSSHVPPTSYIACGQIFHVDLTPGFFFWLFWFSTFIKIDS